MAGSDIVLIGAGRMGLALAKGWLAGQTPPTLSLIDPEPSAEARALSKQPGVTLNPPVQVAKTVVLAIKPQIFQKITDELRAWTGPSTYILSIMAGIRLKTLSTTLGSSHIVRAMPNTPGAIGEGISVFSAGDGGGTTKADLRKAAHLLSPLGQVEGPVAEEKISAVTALSGSGPAYVFLLAEAMAGAGEAEGLPRDLAVRLARQTLIGAAALLQASDETATDLRKAVTSKGGTTQAALDILMHENGMPSLLRQAMRAAALRERKLSGE